ncbi:MAG: permease prefix domain 1-containing protein [Lachnospiraceae bacterium]|nr:permease prefix domain 1-containing protein [Lachnospiraceae bacterium]
METIRNYLEAMFANMPNTEEVKKAKAELFQMMEDKYNELIADGVSENTAVGTVISEFGNLDEIADDLGVSDEVNLVKEQNVNTNRRFVTADEARAFLSSRVKSALLIGIGVMLCIISVIFPIIGDAGFPDNYNFGVIGMFLSIAVAVAMFVYNGVSAGEWSYLEKEQCYIDMNTAEYVKDRKREFKQTKALCLTIGVILCAFCWLPCVAFEVFELAPVSLFAFCGIGVFLIIYANIIDGSFDMLLKINDKKTVSGDYTRDKNVVRYSSKGAEAFMEVYWKCVLCIYLCVSFITFSWGITWIIWPIAAVLRNVFNIILAEEEN